MRNLMQFKQAPMWFAGVEWYKANALDSKLILQNLPRDLKTERDEDEFSEVENDQMQMLERGQVKEKVWAREREREREGENERKRMENMIII